MLHNYTKHKNSKMFAVAYSSVGEAIDHIEVTEVNEKKAIEEFEQRMGIFPFGYYVIFTKTAPYYYNLGGGVSSEVYIEFLNKEKGYQKDVKHFKSYEQAVNWARKNFDKFSPDMIKHKMAGGGGIGDFTIDNGGNYENSQGYELINQFNGTYQVLNPKGNDIAGVFETFEQAKKTVANWEKGSDMFKNGGGVGMAKDGLLIGDLRKELNRINSNIIELEEELKSPDVSDYRINQIEVVLLPDLEYGRSLYLSTLKNKLNRRYLETGKAIKEDLPLMNSKKEEYIIHGKGFKNGGGVGMTKGVIKGSKLIFSGGRSYGSKDVFYILYGKWDELKDKGFIETEETKKAKDWTVAYKSKDGTHWGVETSPYSARYMYSPSLDLLREQNEGEWYGHGSSSDMFKNGGGIGKWDRYSVGDLIKMGYKQVKGEKFYYYYFEKNGKRLTFRNIPSSGIYSGLVSENDTILALLSEENKMANGGGVGSDDSILNLFKKNKINKNSKEAYEEWENEVIEVIEYNENINRSQAQEIVDAKEFEMARSWSNNTPAFNTAQVILGKRLVSSGRSNPFDYKGKTDKIKEITKEMREIAREINPTKREVRREVRMELP